MRKVPYGFWTKERIKQEALKFNYRKDFERAHPSAYRQASRLKIADSVFAHMKRVRNKPY